MIAAPRRDAFAQICHHPRAVGAGILPEDENAVSLVEILQQDRPLADADRLRQADACRLVAHVGAIGKIVGAIFPDKQLIQKRSFVRGPAGRVELGHIRDRAARRDARRSSRTPCPSSRERNGRTPRHRPWDGSAVRPSRARSRSSSASSVTLCCAKNSGVQRFDVASQATALAPFSQNSKDDVCFGSGQAQPGQSNPAGWFMQPQRRRAL